MPSSLVMSRDGKKFPGRSAGGSFLSRQACDAFPEGRTISRVEGDTKEVAGRGAAVLGRETISACRGRVESLAEAGQAPRRHGAAGLPSLRASIWPVISSAGSPLLIPWATISWRASPRRAGHFDPNTRDPT